MNKIIFKKEKKQNKESIETGACAFCSPIFQDKKQKL